MSNSTFADFLPVYLGYLEGKVRPITLDVRHRILSNHFIPYLHHTPIMELSPKDFEAAMESSLRHIHYSALYPAVSHFLSTAVRLGYLTSDKPFRMVLQNLIGSHGRKTERHSKDRELFCRRNILNRPDDSSVSYDPEHLRISSPHGTYSLSLKGFYYDDLREDVRAYIRRMINAGSPEGSCQSFIGQLRAYDHYLFKTNQPYDRNYPMIEDDYGEYLSNLKAPDGSPYSGHTIASLQQKPMTLYYYLKDTDQLTEPDDYADLYLPDYFENLTCFA